jgi:hypothetical protein
MKIAFTICSNNYLAQAKVLGDSLLENNPDYKFIIGLCDVLNSDVDYSEFDNFEIVPFKDINIYNFDEIIEKYDIIELNTSIKPSFFKHFIKKYNNLDKVIYFDPDIEIFNSFSTLDMHLGKNDILITPHIFHPIPIDDLSPSESLFLNYGIYNLGFIAMNAKSKDAMLLLDWWEERTLKIGFNRVCEGLFVDQLWINYIPIFFSNVKILPEYGFNVAPWNLHERSNIELISNEYIMEDNSKLVFFHFSSYDYKKPTQLSKYYNRYNDVINDNVVRLYDQYHQKLVKNNIESLKNIKCFYIKENSKAIKTDKFYYLRKVIPPVFIDLKNKISQL